MKNYTPLLKERWDKGWPAFKQYYSVKQRVDDGFPYKSFRVSLKDKYGDKQGLYDDIYEIVDYSYKPVPEEVACMALKMLSEEKNSSKEIGGYMIYRRFEVDYQDNVNELEIWGGSGGTVILGWRNGELVQTPYDEDEEGRYKTIDLIRGEHNIFDISGYYEAREFGFNWHKE